MRTRGSFHPQSPPLRGRQMHPRARAGSKPTVSERRAAMLPFINNGFTPAVAYTLALLGETLAREVTR